MCPTAAASAADPAPVPTTEGAVPPEFTAIDAHAPSQPEVAAKQQKENGAPAASQSNPYAPRASDYLSNVSPLPCPAGALSLPLSRWRSSTSEGGAPPTGHSLAALWLAC